VVQDGLVREQFEVDTAFYVPPGPPAHHFVASPGSVVAGFAPVTDPNAATPEALEAHGFEVVSRPRRPRRLPRMVRVRGGEHPFRRRGAIEVEGRVMGPWLFMRSQYGPVSGFTGGWCDVPHWGLVLDGAIAINYRSSIELVTAGDAFYADAGHRFEAADGATVIDYTPLTELDGSHRISAWRRAAARKVGILEQPARRAGRSRVACASIERATLVAGAPADRAVAIAQSNRSGLRISPHSFRMVGGAPIPG
jgi:hypothetical protein